ncbi:histidinol-phosphate transaminase [Myroides sp. LJL115]
MKNNLDFKSLIRENIWNLVPYTSAREEDNTTQSQEYIYLDANESPKGEYNRYCDPLQKKLKEQISKVKSIKSENIFLSNGSDEVIDLVYRIFCQPLQDKVVVLQPTYGMYKVYADIHQTQVVGVDLDTDFTLTSKVVDKVLAVENAKVLFICQVNNPSGNLLDTKNVIRLIKEFVGIVVLDQAYIDFVESNDLENVFLKYKNVIVMQTLSKAWAGAGVRLGMAFMDKELVKVFNKVKSPYNISELNQNQALKIVSDPQKMKDNCQSILEQKNILVKQLSSLSIVQKVYPSDANFILVVFKDAKKVFEYLQSKGIIVRNRTSVVKDSLRITIGSPKQNQLVIQSLKQIENA